MHHEKHGGWMMAVCCGLPLLLAFVLPSFGIQAGSGLLILMLAACQAVGYESIGLEKDRHYFSIAQGAIPKLSRLALNGN